MRAQRRQRLPLHQLATNDQLPDLRRPGPDLQELRRPIQPVDLGLAHIAGAAEHLYGVADDFGAALRRVEDARGRELVDVAAAAAADLEIVRLRQRAIAIGP